MYQWSQEPVMYDKDLAKFSAEPWVNLEQLEKRILYDERGYKILFSKNQ